MLATTPLGFTLALESGRGVLRLCDRTFHLATPSADAGGFRFDRLELEIPELSFPFDVSGGAGRFQHRQCSTRSATLSVDETGLERFTAAFRERAVGSLRELVVTLAGGAIRLRGRAATGPADPEIAFTGSAIIEPDGERVRLALCELRLFGPFALPAPLLGLRLLRALDPAPSAPPQFDPLTISGAAFATFHPLRRALMATLPLHGWRMPDTRGLAVTGVTIDGGRLSVIYGGSPPANGPGAPPPDLTAARAAMLAHADAERLLADGELVSAHAAYWTRLEQSPNSRFLVRRLLEVGAAQPALHDEVITLAERLTGEDPEHVPALLARAQVAESRREPDAAARYEAVARALAKAGNRVDQAAALAAVERLQPSARPVAHVSAANATESLTLESALATAARSTAARAAALLDRVSDLRAAEATLAEAVHKRPGDLGAHRLLLALRERTADARAAHSAAVLVFAGDETARPALRPLARIARHLLRLPAVNVAHTAARLPLRRALADVVPLLDDLLQRPAPATSPAPPALEARIADLCNYLEMDPVAVATFESRDPTPLARLPARLLVPTAAFELTSPQLGVLLGRALELLRTGAALFDAGQATDHAIAEQLDRALSVLRWHESAPGGSLDVLSAAVADPTSLSEWLRGTHLTAHRMGWLLEGDLVAALTVAAGVTPGAPARDPSRLAEPALADLVGFALGPALARAQRVTQPLSDPRR
jgi:hypothetical protein